MTSQTIYERTSCCFPLQTFSISSFLFRILFFLVNREWGEDVGWKHDTRMLLLGIQQDGSSAMASVVVSVVVRLTCLCSSYCSSIFVVSLMTMMAVFCFCLNISLIISFYAKSYFYDVTIFFTAMTQQNIVSRPSAVTSVPENFYILAT